MEAAPPAPASPEPTMMTEYLRLLAGLTSFISKRCRSHFFSMGPEGMFARSSMVPPALPDHAGQDHEREGEIPDQDQHGESPGRGMRQGDVSGMRDAESLEHAPD